MDFNEIAGRLYPQRAKGLEPDKIPWDNIDYTWQVKEDGDRRLLYFTKDKVLNSSKSKSASTGLPVCKTDNTPHIRDLNIPELEGTIIDCEFIHNRGFAEGVRKIMGCLPEKAIERQNEWGLIEVYAFDILYYKGKNLADKPLWERLQYLEMVYDYYFKNIDFMKIYITVKGTKEELLKAFEIIVSNGGEGLVAKDINSQYRLSTDKPQSPLKNAWIKVKRDFNGDFVLMGFDEPTREYTGDHMETHSYWMDDDGDKLQFSGMDEAMDYGREMGMAVIPITEFYYKGWIGAIRFGEYENGVLIERGSVTGITKELRADLSMNPNNYIGKVMELDAMERIKKTNKLRQPVFKRFRDDKLPEECNFENQKG